MGTIERAIVSLFATVEKSRAELATHAEALSRGYDFGGQTLLFTALSINSERVVPRIDAVANVRVLSEFDSAETNDLFFRLSVEVRESGFLVGSRIEAYLDSSMGELGPDSHVLYELRSDVLDLDAAVAEIRAQAAALVELAGYQSRLGLRPNTSR